MDRKPLLFVSHSSADAAAAETLRAALSVDFDVWLDQFDLRAGDKWQDSIEARIADCHCAVVVLSPSVRQKPDWVNAEAYAFSLRLRVFDPSFRMIPVLLDGFTEAELVAGPLAKSKLAEIQAPTMTSAAIDAQPIIEGFRPVLEQYRAWLPFQSVARSVAALLDELGSNAQEIIADGIGMKLTELHGAVNRSRWLAAALLRSNRDQLEKSHTALAAIMPDRANRIFRIVAPYTWVDPAAADEIIAVGLTPAPPPPPTLAMNAHETHTPRLYVRRASLKVPEWTTVDCDGDFNNEGATPPPLEKMLLENIRQALMTKLGFRRRPTDEEINQRLERFGEPVFAILPPWFATMDPALLTKLRPVFPRVVYVIWTQDPRTDVARKFPPIIRRLPILDEKVEDDVYDMYYRCLAGEPPL